jgi:hypothetical protein
VRIGTRVSRVSDLLEEYVLQVKVVMNEFELRLRDVEGVEDLEEEISPNFEGQVVTDVVERCISTFEYQVTLLKLDLALLLRSGEKKRRSGHDSLWCGCCA